MSEIIWQDKKRTLFGLPLSFTTYVITEDKLLVQTGFINKKEEEVRLYRILDLTLNRSLGQRLFGVGSIHCCTADKSTPEFDIQSVKNAKEIKDRLSDLIEKERENKRVSSREFMDDETDIHND